jgi:hypothetical protein
MLPNEKVVMTTEEEATPPNIFLHVFEDEIGRDRFVWLAMKFKKKKTKPVKLGKGKRHKQARRQFHNYGTYNRSLLSQDRRPHHHAGLHRGPYYED